MGSADNKKILTISFMAAGVVAGIVVRILLSAAMAVSGSINQALSGDYAVHLIPVSVGLICFLYFQLSKKVLTWADEVITEVRKAVWPSQKDTVAMTIAVVVMVLISGVLLGLLDLVSSKVINLLVTWRA